MVEINKREGIKKNHVYECIKDYEDPLNKKISFKKGDIVMGKDIEYINKFNLQFFKLVGGKDITHHKNDKGVITVIHRRPVEIGDVFFVKFAHTKYKLVTVLDVLEDCEMAAVYPTSMGYLPLGCLVREEKKGWIGVNYTFDFTLPKKTLVKENNETLG